MSFRKHIKRQLDDKGPVRGRRWFVKLDKKNLIREVKMVFHPKEYSEANPKRKLYGDRALYKILLTDKERRDALTKEA